MSKPQTWGDLLLEYYTLAKAIEDVRPRGNNSPVSQQIAVLLSTAEEVFSSETANFIVASRCFEELYIEWHRTLAKWQHEQLLLSAATLNSTLQYLSGKVPVDIKDRVRALQNRIESALTLVVTDDRRMQYQYTITGIYRDVRKVIAQFPEMSESSAVLTVKIDPWQENITAHELSCTFAQLEASVWPRKLNKGALSRKLTDCRSAVEKLSIMDHRTFTAHEYSLMLSAVAKKIEALSKLMAGTIAEHLNNVTIPGQWAVIERLSDEINLHKYWLQDEHFATNYGKVLTLKQELKQIKSADWMRLVEKTSCLQDAINLLQNKVQGFLERGMPLDQVLNGAADKARKAGFYRLTDFIGLSNDALFERGLNVDDVDEIRKHIPAPLPVQLPLLA